MTRSKPYSRQALSCFQEPTPQWQPKKPPRNYQANGQTYEGILVRPDTPGDLTGVSVLIAHDFLGPGENQLTLARDFASQGALVLVADLYGKGRRPDGFEEANAFALALREDVGALRTTMQSALAALMAEGGALDRTLVLGSSVGGLAALELGRTGATVGHIAAMWSVIETTAPDSANPFQSPATVMQGTVDPLGDAEAIAELRAELEAADVPFNIVTYDAVAHAFTLPFVGDDPSTGFAYDADAHSDTSRRLQEILAGL
ncbi:MAG: dienelactone hydrolase family protein [Pseudomonadota bacterium]